MIKKVVLVGLFVISFNVFGGIGGDLQAFFEKMGSTVNVNRGGAYQSQRAGYYSGGGIRVRNNVKNYQIASIQLPSIRAGCGGIDMFMGAFSFIKSEQLVEALRSIGSNAASYAFMLALKTITPMIQSLLGDLFQELNFLNQASINSCEIAANLVDGLWLKADLADRQACTSLYAKDGQDDDWSWAKYKCGFNNRGQTSLYDTVSGKDGKAAYKNMLVDQFNVAWEVIKKNSYLSADKQLAELCMTLTGTIVASRNGEDREVRTYIGKADHDETLNALFSGGSAKIYTCKGEFGTYGKCLNIEQKEVTIGDSGIEHKVRKMLDEIVRKVEQDVRLSDNEIKFIETTKLPIFKLINVLAAYKRAELDLKDYVDIISVDFVYYYISEILDVVLAESANLKNVQVKDEDISTFIKNVQRAKKAIRSKRMSLYQEMTGRLKMIEDAKIYEQKLDIYFDNVRDSM